MENGDGMSTNNIQGTIKIYNEEIPESWAANMSYCLTKAVTPFLMIISDNDDNSIEISLLQKKDKNVFFVKKIKFPLNAFRCTAGAMTSVFMQQLRKSRMYSDNSLHDFLNMFQEMFYPSEIKKEIFMKLSRVLSQEVSFSKIQKIILMLFEKCEIDFSRYSGFLKINNGTNPIISFLADVMTQWNLFIRAVREFLTECPEWKNANNSDLHIFMCGSIRFMSLFIEPENASLETIDLSGRYMIYQMTNEMLKSADIPVNYHLSFTICKESFNKILLNCYYSLKENAGTGTMQKTMTHIFSDKLLCLPETAGIYAGSVKGQFFRFNGNLIHEDKEKNIILAAPFSDEFSTLIALDKVQLNEMNWEYTEDGWKFTLEFTYGSYRYRPRPKVFETSDMIMLEDFPKVVIYQKQNESDFNLYSVQDNIHIELFHGESSENAVRLDGKSKILYFKLYQNDDTFLGQVNYTFIKRRD